MTFAKFSVSYEVVFESRKCDPKVPVSKHELAAGLSLFSW